jgi:hypothetical protein
MKSQVLLVALSLLACAAAQAEDWVSVWKSADGKMEMFVDVANIKIADNIRTASLRRVPAAQTESGLGDNANRWVSYHLSSVSLNCVERTTRDESTNILYFDDGTEERYDNPMLERLGLPEPWRPLPDEPVADAVLQFVCAWSKQ